jgi:uncharacterized protein YndB with AHSA1/START domain
MSITIRDHATSTAPPEEVWKLLYDPLRFPSWWAGMERATLTRTTTDGSVPYTYWFEGWPEAPMSQVLRSEREAGRVRISCLVSNMQITWQLGDGDAGGTQIDVEVLVPDEEHERLDDMRAMMRDSVQRLAELAATDALPARG